MIEHSRPTIGEPEIQAVLKVLKSRLIYEGETVRKFEDDLSTYIGARGAVATSTGTAALHLALVSLGVVPGDEIILPCYVCRSVLNSILYCDATPVLCDINSRDYNISFLEAKRKITRKTKALIVPHMFGYPADMEQLKTLGVPIIEDCAHAIGSKYQGRMAGSFGDLAVCSFEGTKYITTGEGGAVVANSGILLKKLRRLKEPDARDSKIKYTYRMTNLQAAIGRAQLIQLPYFIKKRRAIAKAYHDAFACYPVSLPVEQPGKLHTFQRYMITMKADTDSFMANCLRKGVKVKRPVKPFLLSQYLGCSSRNYPNSMRAMRSAVSIPIYPSLTKKDVAYIIHTVCRELDKIPK